MSDSKTLVLETMKSYGRTAALSLQTESATLTGTELHEQSDFIPTFEKAVTNANMLTREAGFLVFSALQNCCKLLTPYDSATYPDEPENYPSMWGFKWSTDSEKATAFVSSSTSTYGVGECCVGSDGVTYASTIADNVHDPVQSPEFWEVAES